MNAAELIEYIRTAEKKTPVKVYIWERFPTSFPNAKVFPAGDGAKIVFGDWRGHRPRRPGAAGRHCRYRDRKQLPQFSRSSAGHEGSTCPDRAGRHHSRAGRDRGGSRHHDGRHHQHRRKRGRRNHDRHGRSAWRPRNGRRTLPHRRRRSAGRGDRACKRDARSSWRTRCSSGRTPW